MEVMITFIVLKRKGLIFHSEGGTQGLVAVFHHLPIILQLWRPMSLINLERGPYYASWAFIVMIMK